MSPFPAHAGYVLFNTGDVNAAGREAALELTGLDIARDGAEILGAGFEEAQREIDEFSVDVKVSKRWGMGPAYKQKDFTEEAAVQLYDPCAPQYK